MDTPGRAWLCALSVARDIAVPLLRVGPAAPGLSEAPRRPADGTGPARAGPGVSVIPARDAGQRLELVERRGRGKGPLQRRRALAPRIVRGLLLAGEGHIDAVEEDE